MSVMKKVALSNAQVLNVVGWYNNDFKKNKKNDRIKYMLVNVATKDTCITRTTIRNRFIELT